MPSLISQNTMKRTLIVADHFFRTQNDAALLDEFRVAAIATLTSFLRTLTIVFAQTLSLAQLALPLRILQAATYEDLENAMEA